MKMMMVAEGSSRDAREDRNPEFDGMHDASLPSLPTPTRSQMVQDAHQASPPSPHFE